MSKKTNRLRSQLSQLKKRVAEKNMEYVSLLTLLKCRTRLFIELPIRGVVEIPNALCIEITEEVSRDAAPIRVLKFKALEEKMRCV